MPFPSPGDLPEPETEAVSLAFAGGFFTTEPPGKPTSSVGFYLHEVSTLVTFIGMERTVVASG